jgi:hypothetical protein
MDPAARSFALSLMLALSPLILTGATSLPRSSPEAQGLASAAVQEFVQAAET